MKILQPLINLPKSMMGQIVILTLLFMGGLIYYVAIKPISEIPSTDNPMRSTESLVTSSLRTFMRNVEKDPEHAGALEDDDVIREIMATNPDFKFYIRQNNFVYTNGNENDRFNQQRFESVHRYATEQKDLSVCTNASYSSTLENEEKQVSAYYSYCGDDSYYLEFSGIVQPLRSSYFDLSQYYPKWFWSFSQLSLYAAGGVFLIAVIILLFNIRAIRRVANVANSLDPKKLNKTLPENGLPKEVLPLVKAVNQMMGKVEDTQKKHNFFLSTAAHEMRTPLTVLRTRLESLEDGDVKDKLVNDVRKLVTLVNQLLRLMRVGGPQSLKSQVDVVATCEKVINERRSHARIRQCELVWNSKVDHYWVNGEQDLLEVALANLIDNALSFSPAGGKVEVQLSEAGVLQVIDHGPGIDNAHLASLFEPFAKFPPNRNGHGLGLAIVKAVAQLHHADINASNGEQGGAVFTLTFPERLMLASE